MTDGPGFDLRASEERLQMALRGADLAMWDWNIQTGDVHFDDRWLAILGYAPGEVESSFDLWLNALHPDDVDRATAIVDDHLAGRTPDFTQEFRMRHKDGRWVWILARGKVVERDADGSPLRACGTHLDITAQKETELDRRRLEAQIRHTQKLESLGVLAGGIAHDFNNLLVSILGNADLMLGELPDDAPMRPYLDDIRTAAQRASDLTNQMLAYSGKGHFVVEAASLGELVTEMGGLLDISLPKSVELSYELADDMPPVEVDATQVRQVIMNLVTNAADAMDAGPGMVTIATGLVSITGDDLVDLYRREQLPDGEYVFLEVRDTGCGMDDETRARLFDPFFTTKAAGRGLGMAAVLGIVHGHRGTIEVESMPGRGSTFRVLLPAGSAPAPAPAPARAVAPEVTDSAELPAATVLVVDDEEGVRTLARRMLERAGLSVLTAGDGLEAVALYEEQGEAVDLVLLDMTMPRLDGLATMQRLQRIDPAVRVILSSGFSEVEATDRFAGAGLMGFIQKPYTLDVLLTAVRNGLAG